MYISTYVVHKNICNDIGMYVCTYMHSFLTRLRDTIKDGQCQCIMDMQNLHNIMYIYLDTIYVYVCLKPKKESSSILEKKDNYGSLYVSNRNVYTYIHI